MGHHHNAAGGHEPAAGRSAAGKSVVDRRHFLKRSALGIAAIAVAPGALLNSAEAWAVEVKSLKPATMKALILIARDIYPHDHVPDRFYAVAMKPYDEKSAADAALKAKVESFVASLDSRAGEGGYVGLGWEAERTALLRASAADPMFETIRSGLVVSLYNQQELWPLFGYEGESFSKGGYISRGFDDVAWL